MGTHSPSSAATEVVHHDPDHVIEGNDHLEADVLQVDDLDTDVVGDTPAVVNRSLAVRARQQVFGFTTLGVLCCLAALVFSRWSPEQDPGRWFWSIVGSMAGVICLFKAQRSHGGVSADRDASPYYGIFAGVTTGAVLLIVLSVDGWVVPGMFFVIAAILAFMAWLEQSAIGMTAAVCVAVLCAGSGVAVLDDAVAAGLGSIGLGVMLLTAAVAMGVVEEPVS